MNPEPIMIFHIQCYWEQVSAMDLSNGGKVVIIPFGGTVESPLFTGHVLPGAADMQTTNTAGVCHMCARYMFEGVDSKGQSCHLFVENNGFFQKDNIPSPFHTTPIMKTDSKELEDYLMGDHFRAEGHPSPIGVDIHIYDTKADQ